jgi:hypothetical protein
MPKASIILPGGNDNAKTVVSDGHGVFTGYSDNAGVCVY